MFSQHVSCAGCLDSKRPKMSSTRPRCRHQGRAGKPSPFSASRVIFYMKVAANLHIYMLLGAPRQSSQMNSRIYIDSQGPPQAWRPLKRPRLLCQSKGARRLAGHEHQVHRASAVLPGGRGLPMGVPRRRGFSAFGR